MHRTVWKARGTACIGRIEDQRHCMYQIVWRTKDTAFIGQCVGPEALHVSDSVEGQRHCMYRTY